MTRAPVNPAVLTWARERAGCSPDTLKPRFPKLTEWEAGARAPTFKQAEAIAARLRVPVGYLFLSEPPAPPPMPIPDFRTLRGAPPRQPSPDLLEVFDACRARQDWYRGFARLQRLDELAFIGSARTTASPQSVAARMRETIGFDVADRRSCRTWEEALRRFIGAVDDAGVLVMVSGIVASNTSRKLDPEEFRGFALSDPLAPLVFVNGADAKAAQMFTLAHELAHLWLGSSALSDCQASTKTGLRAEEVWCNAVAAEFLAPMEVLRRELRPDEPLAAALGRLARVFKVSRLVALRHERRDQLETIP